MSRDSGDAPTIPSGDGPTRPAHGAAKPPRSEPEARYALEGEIARGGMGRVVEAIDRELDRRVAIKEALTTDMESLLRFRREIWITARLEHPAIVPLYDAGTHGDGTPFYVMRKIGGRPLVELVQESTTVEARLALVPHVLAAARAIAHAHQRRVVHRDLKPSNILVGELGETVVIDWGLAKLYGEIDEATGEVSSPVADAVATRVGTVMGTPGFMPPEQVAGGEADPRVDVYALGATLYYVLARQLPHAHSSTEALYEAVQHPATPIAKLVPEVPRDLAAIVDVAISPERENRFADAGAMAAELERFLAGRLIASRRYTRWERLVRFVNRHRVAVITVAVATLALAIGGALAFDRVLSARGRAEDALADAVHEREVAQGLLETMTLDRARSLTETNPTAAVALVRPLAAGPRWREVRAIVAAAEAHGVASSMTGPEVASSLVLAPTAPRAAALDGFGHLWTYDLETHRSTDRGTFTRGETRIDFLDDRTLVIAEPAHIRLLDLVANTRREFSIGGLIATAAGRLIVHQPDNQLIDLDVATGRTRVLGSYERESGTLSLSKDGEWLLLRIPRAVLVIERATGRIAHELRFDAAFTRWDPERSDRFVVSELERITVVTFDKSSANRREISVNDFGGAALSGNRLCFSGRNSTGLLEPFDEREPTPKGALPMISVGAYGLCYTLGSTRIRVYGDVTPRELVSPIQITRLAASRDNPYVIASGLQRIVAWRVTPAAKRVMNTGSVSLFPTGRSGVMFGRTIEREPVWHYADLQTGQVTRIPLPPRSFALEPVTASDGDVVAFRDIANHRAIVIGLRSGHVTVIDEDVPVLAVGGRAVVGTKDGRVSTIDESGNLVEVARGAKAPNAVYVTPTSLAIAWPDGRLWFRSPSATRELTYDKPVRDLLIVDDDVVLVSGERSIELWRADGVTPLLTTTLPITSLTSGNRDHLVVFLQGSTLMRIDRGDGTQHRLATGANMSFSAASQRALIYRSADLELHELDVETGWKIDVPTTPITPGLTSDGRWIALVTDEQLYAIPIELPETVAEVAARIELLTNAEVDRAAPSSVIRWRD